MQRVLISAGVMSAALLLGGCGSAPPDAASTGATATGVASAGSPQDDYSAKQQKAENMIADCMKEKGFRYVPRTTSSSVSRADQYVGPASLLQPDEVVRPLRQKYGFGVAAKEVYPDDPIVGEPRENAAEDPNNKIRDGLDDAQRRAYDKAMGTGGKAAGQGSEGCGEKAYIAVFGTTDLNRTQADAKRAWDKFGSDPAVVAAARKYADCLRGKGYRITGSEPGEVETFVLREVRPAGAAAVGEEDPAKSTGDPKAALAEEIKKALDDLDCRGSYADIVRTRYPSIVGLTRNQG